MKDELPHVTAQFNFLLSGVPLTERQEEKKKLVTLTTNLFIRPGTAVFGQSSPSAATPTLESQASSESDASMHGAVDDSNEIPSAPVFDAPPLAEGEIAIPGAKSKGPTDLLSSIRSGKVTNTL